MSTVPYNTLENLICAFCGGFLNKKPVSLNKSNQHFCGKCYDVIPEEVRNGCIREIALESLLEAHVFPCRYYKNGCKKTLKFNEDNTHEDNCNYKFSFYMKNKKELSTEAIETTPLIQQHIYETLNPKVVKCFSCNSLSNSPVFHCLFGHSVCKNCKGNICPLCTKQINQEEKIRCENYKNGCNELLDPIYKSGHECVYRKIQCPLCNYKNIMSNLITHLKEDHENEIIEGKEVLKTFAEADQVWVMICHNNVFKCVYYNCGDILDFFVICLGNYFYKYSYSFDFMVDCASKMRKKGKCSNVNNRMIDKGVVLDRAWINHENDSIKFDGKIKIRRLSHK